jgi:hypothetical protein
MFSMAGAVVFLPFLPMLPLQILLNNFLYDLAQVTIPTDPVQDSPQGSPCGNAKPHRVQAGAPAGGNGLPQPGQCVANRIPQWAQNCQCGAISRRQSRHSWRSW